MRKQKKQSFFSTQNAISIFIIFIMVSSVIGYMWGKDSATKYEYNDHSFFQRNNQWILKYQGEELNFDFFPEQVEDIEIGSDLSSRLKGIVELDSTSSSEGKYLQAVAKSQYDINDNLGKVSDAYIVVGMTEVNEFELPVIVCNNATSSVPVLYFKDSNETKIVLDGDCIIAEARSEMDVLRVKDRLLFDILGII